MGPILVTDFRALGVREPTIRDLLVGSMVVGRGGKQWRMRREIGGGRELYSKRMVLILEIKLGVKIVRN